MKENSLNEKLQDDVENITPENNSDAHHESPSSEADEIFTSPDDTKEESSEKKKRSSFPIVGMGASAGGLEAFEQFFKNMPSDNGMAFILVPHLDPNRKSIMVDLLRRYTTMEVIEVEEGMEVQPNHVYVIPPNKCMSILNRTLQLMELVEPRSLNLPIDTFLRSLAENQRENAIGIILSGTGSSGSFGLKAIKSEGGMVIVQEPKSAKYDGMPRSAINTGLVDYILPVEKIPQQLIQYVKQFRLREHRAAKDEGCCCKD